MYADFDTSKIRPGEPVAILGNDPSVPSGKALYIAFAANDVRRLCSIEDISEMVNAGEFVGPQGPRGEKGDKGDPGEKGADGTVAFESLTPEQKESLRGISIKSASVDTDGNLTITFSDGDSEDIGNIMGPQGIPGPKGDKGDVGPQGLKGDKGDVGPKGDNMSDEQAQQIEQNKTDIASLKEDLSTKITKFYASSQGETHLADSDNGKITDTVLYGRSEQKQYSGKNLLNPTLQTTIKNGVTCTANGDGTYTLNGTTTTTTVFDIAQDVSYSSFRLAGCPVGGAHDASYELQARTDNLIYGYDTGDGKNIKANENFFIRIRINTGINCNNLLFKPMIVDASLYPDATYDDFEPYTGGIPSPNPDYPQEIKSVVNPTVKVCGKNLLNYDAWSQIDCANGKAVYENNGVTITALRNDAFTNYDMSKFPTTARIPVNVGETITISWDEPLNKEGRVYVFGNASTSNMTYVNNSSSKQLKYTIPSGVTFITFRFGVGNAGDTISYRNIQIELGSTPTAYEPYHEQTVTLPYTLNAIPVSSGGNVTINGQQYVSDYVDVERGKLVRMVGECVISDMNQITRITTNTFFVYGMDDVFVISDNSDDIARLQTTKYQGVALVDRTDNKYIYRCWLSTHDNLKPIAFHSNTDDLSAFKNEVYGTRIIYQLANPTEIDLTPEEIAAFKSLATYYPVTNIFINSEQLDGYTVFNYPVSMENGWNYVKQQIGDTRNYIYDMDARAQDTDLQAAEAYVNSEYAVALTELEV
jgi:hypothetical protein